MKQRRDTSNKYSVNAGAFGQQILSLDYFYKQMGSLGSVFQRAVARANPHEIVSRDTELAAYIPHCSGLGDRHYIEYNPSAARDIIKLLQFRFHEMTHVFQYQKTPVLHAVSINPVADDLGIMLSPKAYLQASILLEQDAAAKESWLIAEALKACSVPKTMQGTNGYNYAQRIAGQFHVMHDVWSTKMPRDERLQRAINELAMGGLDYEVSSGVSAKIAYGLSALHSYDEMIAQWKDMNGGQKPVLVDLTKQDILEIGNSFGPNSFADTKGQLHNVFASQFDLLPRIAVKKIFEQAHALGYSKPSSGVTLDQALSGSRCTRQDFLKLSLAP